MDATPTDKAGHHRLALVLISAAQLMVVLDASIVNVALPSIQRALNFSFTNLVWVINGYTLAFGGLLLLGGRTGDVFGRRKMFMVGISVFTFASFTAGLATTEWMLIASRVLQGMGGAIAAPTALALIASTFAEGKERNRAMGVYAAMSGAGGAIGVLAGGILTDLLSWRWVFFVNVPIGLFIVLAAPRVLADGKGKRTRLDLPGALLASSGMTLLVFGLIHAGSTSWSDRWTIISLVAGIVILLGFLVLESRTPNALLPLSLFRSRSRSTAYAIMLAIGTAVFTMFYFLTLFLQDVLGYSPLKAGLAFLPFVVILAGSAGAASHLVGRTGPKPLLMVGTVLASGGLGLFSTVTATSSWLTGVLPAMVLVAIGMAFCFVPLTLAAVAGVGPAQQGIASAILNSGQQVGGSLGLALLGTLAAQATRSQLTVLGPTAAKLAGSAPPPKSVPLPAGVRTVVENAYVHGYTTAFGIGALIMVGAFVLAAFVLPRQSTSIDLESLPTSI